MDSSENDVAWITTSHLNRLFFAKFIIKYIKDVSGSLIRFIICNISGKLSLISAFQKKKKGLISIKLDAHNGIAIPTFASKPSFQVSMDLMINFVAPFSVLNIVGCCGPCGPCCFYFANIMEKGWLIWDFFNIRIFIWLMQKYLIFNSVFPIL